MDERSPFCAARRSRAQRHRYRLYKGWFFRGYRCATGPPGLSNCWVDIDTPEVTEVGESLELACQSTAQNGDEEAISTEHFENIIVHEAAGGTCDQHGKPNLAETEVLQKAASWEVRGAPAHDLVDEMCLAGTAQPENDGGDAAQSMTSINRRQHKRKLCSSQKHFVKQRVLQKDRLLTPYWKMLANMMLMCTSCSSSYEECPLPIHCFTHWTFSICQMLLPLEYPVKAISLLNFTMIIFRDGLASMDVRTFGTSRGMR
ncbi:unnamed protein product [Polarella glacialis]|uniref:Uncharacterized protein n=1 Tax=Polarella glacialis TaxID=89957 RepID=A0A813GN99_POLGL|nr:unnamed protein product [Polarella glacialis]